MSVQKLLPPVTAQVIFASACTASCTNSTRDIVSTYNRRHGDISFVKLIGCNLSEVRFCFKKRMNALVRLYREDNVFFFFYLFSIWLVFYFLFG